MRVHLLEPCDPRRKLTVDVVLDAVFLVHADLVSRRVLQALTEIELALVYDWAAREHLAATDSDVERRPRPSCLDLAVIVSSLVEVAEGEPDEFVAARFRERLTELSRRFDALTATPGPVPASAVSTSSSGAEADSPPDQRPTSSTACLVDHRISIDFVLRLPPGSEPPTPTREAVDAAALAMAGPRYEIGPRAQVSCVEAAELWEALSAAIRPGVGSRPASARSRVRSRIHRALVRAGVTSSGALRRLDKDALRRISGLGPASVRALSRAGLLSPDGARRRSRGIRR